MPARLLGARLIHESWRRERRSMLSEPPIPPFGDAARPASNRILMKTLALLLSASSLAFLAGCASVSVRSEHRAGAQPARKPVKIYVADFDTSHGGRSAIAGDGAKNPEAFKKNAQKLMSDYLVKNLSAHVAPAERGQEHAARSCSHTGLAGDGKVCAREHGQPGLEAPDWDWARAAPRWRPACKSMTSPARENHS